MNTTTVIRSQEELVAHYDGDLVIECDVNLPGLNLSVSGMLVLKKIVVVKSIEAGGWILSLRFEITCKLLITKRLPFWRAYWAAMPPLRPWAKEILDEKNCWDSLKILITKDQAKEIAAWDGWHPILRAQLEMFLGLRESVPGEELIVKVGREKTKP